MKSFTAISCTILAALQVAAAAPSTRLVTKASAADTAVSISYEPAYAATLSMDSVKCSTGIPAGGTKYATVGDLPGFPYVGGAPTISGTDTNCGKCYELTYNGKTINILAIDYSTGFNINPDAFTALTGDLDLGRVDGTYTEVDGSACGL